MNRSRLSIPGNPIILALFRRLILFSGLLVLVYRGVDAQDNYYLEVSGNYSDVSAEEYTVSLPSTLPSLTGPTFRYREEYKTVPGFQVEVGKTWNITSRLFLESGLAVRQMGYTRKNVWLTSESSSGTDIQIETIEGTPMSVFYGFAGDEPGQIRFVDTRGYLPAGDDLIRVGVTPNEYRTSLYYLDLPLSIQYTILNDRFSAGIGIQPSFLASGKVSYEKLEFPSLERDSLLLVRWTLPGSDTLRFTALSPVMRTVTDDSGNGFKNTIWHGNILSKYRLFDRFWISAAYYHAFVPLQDNRRGKARFVKIGIRYTF